MQGTLQKVRIIKSSLAFLPPLTTIFTGLTYPYAYILFPLIIEGR